jgi:hypothetical protein
MEPDAMRSFWNWFRGNGPALHAVTSEDDPLWAELGLRLNTLHPDLTFELGAFDVPGSSELGRREFVISAGGAREAFPAVRALTAAAPELPDWRVVPFRPRRELLPGVSVLGLALSPEQVRFELRPEPGGTGIVLYIPGYEKSDHARYVAAAFLLLDTAVGEVDVEMNLGSIELRPLCQGSGEGAELFPRLPSSLDNMTTTTQKSQATHG